MPYILLISGLIGSREPAGAEITRVTEGAERMMVTGNGMNLLPKQVSNKLPQQQLMVEEDKGILEGLAGLNHKHTFISTLTSTAMSGPPTMHSILVDSQMHAVTPAEPATRAHAFIATTKGDYFGATWPATSTTAAAEIVPFNFLLGKEQAVRST
ncbi:unnamed protein product [Prunus armeniaca]